MRGCASLRRTVVGAMPIRAWKAALRRFGRARVHGKPPPFAYVHRPQALRPGNRIVPLRGGEEAYPAMLSAIAGAREYVHLETYILRADRIGTRFQQALIDRARAGVKVRLIFDSAGSFGLPDTYVQELTAAGVEVIEFHPLAPWRQRWAYNQRDHKKILVVDCRLGFIGGINIGDEYVPIEEGGAGWFDMHARVEGPVVEDLDRLFHRTWHGAGGEPFTERTPTQPHRTGKDAGCLALTIDNTGLRNRSRKRAAYLHAIRASYSAISLMNSYFIPDQGLRRAFYRAVTRGVVVRIIVPSQSDVRVVLLASRHLYPRLLQRGVRIFEWPGPMMHAKSAVIDEIWSTIGSYNIDWRSFLHNLEASLVILDQAFGERMRRDFEEAVARCHEVTYAECLERSGFERFLQWFCYLFRYWL